MQKEEFIEFKEMLKIENEGYAVDNPENILYEYVYIFYQIGEFINFYELCTEDLDNCKALANGLLINDANVNGSVFVLNWNQILILTTDHPSHKGLYNMPDE